LSPRTAARATLLLLAAAAAALALGPPQFTWANEGLRVQHPLGQAVAALLGAVALAVAALPLRPRALAALALAGAFGLAGLAAQRFAWKVEAAEAGLRERTLAGWTRIAWRDVEAVDSRAEAVVLRGRDGPTIALATRGFGADDRSRLERTIARRIKEASTATGLR
jgi:hypothetical protein